MAENSLEDSAVKRWRIPLVEDTSEKATAIGGQGGSRSTRRSPVSAGSLGNISEEAYQEGLAQGKKEGYEAGLLQAKKEMEAAGKAHIAQLEMERSAASEKLTFIFSALENPLHQRERSAEHALVELATAIAKQLVRRELHVDQGEVVAVVREAMALLPISNQVIKIRLHPEDAVFIRKIFHDGAEQAREWNIVDDPSLKRGDCKINTEDSSIDASLDARIASIMAHLLGGAREQDHDD